jgi:diaminopimelate decarboxylase
MNIVETPVFVNGQLERPATPLYIRRLAALRDNYHSLKGWFEAAKRAVGYPGSLLVAYASKANPSQPVVRTLLQAGAAYELSLIHI